MSICGFCQRALTEVTRMDDGSTAVERGLHRRFWRHRKHGEWFRLSKDIREYIESSVTERP